MIFEPGTDVMRARQLVQERLTLAYTLPNVAKAPVMIQPLSATNRVMMIGLSSTEISGMDLSVLARWTIKPRLMGITGVANVAVWGHRERQLQVQVDPERLQAAGLTQDQIIRTTGDDHEPRRLDFPSTTNENLRMRSGPPRTTGDSSV